MYMMVLNDGETFTNLSGCKIVDVPDDEDPEYVGSSVDGLYYPVICEFGEATDHESILVYWRERDRGIVEFNKGA